MDYESFSLRYSTWGDVTTLIPFTVVRSHKNTMFFRRPPILKRSYRPIHRYCHPLGIFAPVFIAVALSSFCSSYFLVSFVFLRGFMLAFSFFPKDKLRGMAEDTARTEEVTVTHYASQRPLPEVPARNKMQLTVAQNDSKYPSYTKNLRTFHFDLSYLLY